MSTWIQIAVTIVASVLASSGLWAFVLKKSEQNDTKNDILVGIAHDRIRWLGLQYMERGYITPDEYENLHDYLYVPYAKRGGNGSAKKIMEEVNKLPMKEN